MRRGDEKAEKSDFDTDSPFHLQSVLRKMSLTGLANVFSTAFPRMSKRKPQSAPKSSVNIHDRFVRSVFAHVELVAAFLRLYVAPILLKQLDLRRIKLEPTHFFGEEGRERIADLIFSIPLKRKRGSMKVVFVFEHKSERKRSLGFQLLKYLVAIWNKFFSDAKNPESNDFFLPAPLLIVLHNGSKPLIDKPTLEKIIAKVAGTERFIPKF